MPHGLGQGTPGQPNIKFGGGWSPGPADQAHGPHRLNFDAWQLLTGSQGRFQGVELQFSDEWLVAPSYKYKGRGENRDTPPSWSSHPSSAQLQASSCV